VKTALEGKRFQDAENVNGKVKVEINAVPLETFADCFQKLLNDSTNIFKLKESQACYTKHQYQLRQIQGTWRLIRRQKKFSYIQSLPSSWNVNSDDYLNKSIARLKSQVSR
jgi:hypothetical protein